MKKGYHSTQRKYFNTVPRSEFLGLALGYGCGLVLSGLLKYDGQWLSLGGAAVGTAIGYYIDGKYFAEKDVPVEEIDGYVAPEPEPEDPPLMEEDEEDPPLGEESEEEETAEEDLDDETESEEEDDA